ncbi:MAG: SDR family NAD(P)-dependent oxidoreductase, partial [Thermicanus sp.]|nr:SDR family NAD(P)-dependent oxidoreductase [Thermicanus sp.]
MDLKLSGKIALVSGASQGLGFAIARELYKEGASVALLSRSIANLDKAKASLQSDGKGEIFTVPADLSHKEEIEKALHVTLEHFGGVDLLLANAGGPPMGKFESITDEDFYRAFETNFMSTVRLIRGLLPVMRERGGGRIGIITSTSVKEPIEGLLLSNSIRAGITGLARTLANEVAKDNILINCFAPGRFHTERVAYLDQKIAGDEGISPQEVEH